MQSNAESANANEGTALLDIPQMASQSGATALAGDFTGDGKGDIAIASPRGIFITSRGRWGWSSGWNALKKGVSNVGNAIHKGASAAAHAVGHAAHAVGQGISHGAHAVVSGARKLGRGISNSISGH